MYKVALTLFFLICTSSVFAQAESDLLAFDNDSITKTEVRANSVQYCNPKGHAQCIRITAKEVFEDGSKGKWSRHWKRMSYIGEACVAEHGEKKGKALEALFAPGHYFAMTFVNIAGLTKYAFKRKNKRSAEE